MFDLKCLDLLHASVAYRVRPGSKSACILALGYLLTRTKNKKQQARHCAIHGLHQVPALEPLYNGHEEDNWWKYNTMKDKFHEHALLQPFGFLVTVVIYEAASHSHKYPNRK